MRKKNGDRAEYTSIFEKFLKDSLEFPEAFDIVKKNSQGRIWVIGGFIYRNVIRSIYGEIKGLDLIDIDFLMEKSAEGRDLYTPKGWDPKIADYGNPYLLKEDGKVRIDLNYLRSFHPIITRRLKPRIRHFFTTTPLDIQSISYDLTDKKIGMAGWRGIEAIKRKAVRINNLEEAKFVAKNRGVSIEDLVKGKAEELGFGYNVTPMIVDYQKIAKRLGTILEEIPEKR